MGNKNTGPPKGPDAVSIQKEDDLSTNTSAGSVSRDRPPGPSAELLTSLQSLGEHSDYTLLPQSLHQIAEAYSLKEDYQWAVQFLQLEKLYHERLLSNLSALQEDWESQRKEKNATESSVTVVTSSVDEEHIEVLSQICRTHHRPSLCTEKSISDTMLTDIQSIVRQCDMNEMAPPQHDKVNDAQMAHRQEDEDEEEEQQSMTTESETSSQQCAGHREGGGCEEGQQEEDEEEAYEEGQEAEEEGDGEVLDEATPEEEQVKVEWPAGVPQASVKDLVKLSHKEESSSPDGLVSILKRRRASLDGLPPSGPADDIKTPSKRKVRFIEPEDAMEHDEVGGDSCLILLLLCLVTVVISIGGTALYCTLVDTYSNICTDFSHNVDFYVMNVRRFLDELRRWFPLWT